MTISYEQSGFVKSYPAYSAAPQIVRSTGVLTHYWPSCVATLITILPEVFAAHHQMTSLCTRIASTRVLVDGKLVPATVSLKNGKITAIESGVAPDAKNYGTLVILPGLVDAHVHLNQPGRTDWEGFETGTKAAAFGGVTTVVDMPLNSIPPTTTVAAYEEKLAAAKDLCYVDIAFWGGVIPGNQQELKALVRAGVVGFKCFLIESGVDEFPHVTMDEVDKAIAALHGEKTILMFHAEMDCCHHSAPKGDPRAYKTFLESRPDSFEVDAITAVIDAAKRNPGLDLHIVHLASAAAIPLLKRAQDNGVRLSAETCFHYLTFAAEQIPDADPAYKCCPPIRDAKTRATLWDAVLNGTIKTIVSDHSPCTPDLKIDAGGDLLKAWGGIASVGFGLPLLWTAAQTKHNITLPDISRWTSLNTAKQTGLDYRKGSIEVGKDADFCIFDPDAEWTVDESTMMFKNKYSPYAGQTLRGKVKETIVRGTTVFADDEFKGPFGIPLRRQTDGFS